MTPPLKLSPLNATAERLGARWQELAGWRCPQAYGDRAAGAEAAAARAGAGLADVSALGKIQIEGRQASAVLSAVLAAVPEAIGGHSHVPAGDLYCLRPDMFFLRTAPGGEPAACAALATAVAAHPDVVTVTDVTHGLAGIELMGPRAVDVLTRVCGLDFSPVSFPVDAARQTSVAKTRQLILHHTRGGLPSYTLFGARSLAAYLWGVLLAAGQPFGLTPVGLDALNALEAPQKAAE